MFQHYVSLRSAAEYSTGYLRMKSQDSSYVPMNAHSNDCLTESNPSYLIPQSPADHRDDDDDDDDDAMKTSRPAAAAENDTTVVSLTRDNAEKPLLNRANQTVPGVKYSAVKQHDH